jgi:hypothetical protein
MMEISMPGRPKRFIALGILIVAMVDNTWSLKYLILFQFILFNLFRCISIPGNGIMCLTGEVTGSIK